MSKHRTTATVNKFTAWVIPVKVEDLKAGLRTLMATAERRAALEDCAARLGSHLPAELLDMIMDHVPDLYEKRRKQWTMLYSCSIGSTSGVEGTVFTHAMSRSPGGESLRRPLHMIFSVCRCDAPCRNCGRYLAYLAKPASGAEIWSPTRTYQVDYEDSLVNLDTSWDELHNDKTPELIMGDYYYYQSVKKLAKQWQAGVNKDALFTQTERRFLQSYLNVDCWVQRNKHASSPFANTTALLHIYKPRPGQTQTEPSGVTLRSISPVADSSLPTDETLPTDEQAALNKALRVLRLVPCDQLERQRCTQGTAQKVGSWPRRVILQEKWVDTTQV